MYVDGPIRLQREMEPITVMSLSNWIPTGHNRVKGVRENPVSKIWTFTIDHPEPEDRDKLLQSPYQYLIMTRDQETLRGCILKIMRRTYRYKKKKVHPRAQWKLCTNTVTKKREQYKTDAYDRRQLLTLKTD
jgi:hypothetical protein